MRSVLIYISCMLAAGSALAQKAFVSISGSYNLPLTLGQSLVMDGYPYTGTGAVYPGNTPRYSRDKASLGAGFHGQVSAGFWFKKNLGAELSGDLGLATRSYTITVDNTLKTTTTIKQYSKMPFVLVPSFLFGKSIGESRVYGKIGVVIPLSNRIYTESLTAGAPGDYYFDKTEMKTDFNLGFQLGAGYNYVIKNNLSAFAELSLTSLNFKTRQSNLVESTVNGKDNLGMRYKSQQQVNYTDGGAPSDSPDIDQPGQAEAYKIPFGTIGLKLGISYRF